MIHCCCCCRYPKPPAAQQLLLPCTSKIRATGQKLSSSRLFTSRCTSPLLLPLFPPPHFCPSPTAHFTHALSHLVLICPPSLPFFLLHSITFVFLPSLPLAAILIAAAARHCICIALSTRTYREPCPSSSPPSSPPSYSSSSSRATSESRRVSLLVPPSPLLPLFPSSASRPDDPRL